MGKSYDGNNLEFPFEDVKFQVYVMHCLNFALRTILSALQI